MIFLESLTKESLPAEEIFLVHVRSTLGFFPYKKFYEAVELFCGRYNFTAAKDLSEALGPYQIDDVLCDKLKKEKIKILQDGRLPFFSAVDYLDSKLLQESVMKSFSFLEIKEKCLALGLDLLCFTCKSEELKLLETLIRAANINRDENTTWKRLEIFLVTFSHKYPTIELKLSCTREMNHT